MAYKGSSSVENTSDEIGGILCEPCEKDGEHIEAEGYCADCKEYLCKQCYNYHRKLKVFQNHYLLDKNQMPQLPTSGPVIDVHMEKCKVHGNKTIDLFCGSCGTLACSECVPLNHRRCSNVDHIANIATGNECSKQFREISKDLDDLLQQFDSSTELINANITDFGNLCIRARAELKRQRADVNRYFDRLERITEKQINDKEIDVKSELQDVVDYQTVLISGLQQMKSDLETKMKNGNKTELFITMQKAKHILAGRRDDLKIDSRKKNIVYIPSLQVEDMIKRICSMGSVVVKGSEKISAAKVRTKINLSTSKDKISPVLSGVCVLSEHYVIVIDNANKSVKVVDLKKSSVTAELGMSTRLWDITLVKDDKVAVTLPDQKKIQFLIMSKEGKLIKDHHIEVKDECAGISCSRDYLIVSCLTYIQILDLKGTVKRKIVCDENGEGLFKRALYLVLSADLETIYVSDNLNNTVTRVTLNGKVKDIYKDLTMPYGILVDNGGCVFVSSIGSKNIHQLSTDCGRIGILNLPVGCMAFSCSDNKIYAGGFGNEMYIIY